MLGLQLVPVTYLACRLVQHALEAVEEDGLVATINCEHGRVKKARPKP